MKLIHTTYQPEGDGPYPAILTLHGRGANAMDLLGLAPLLCEGKFLMICPQGPLETPLGPGLNGYSWYPMSMGGPPDMTALVSARGAIQEFLEECLRRYPIDAKKLALLGFSQGGVMAYNLLPANPAKFAAVAALSTWLPEELAAQLSAADTLRSLPILVQHGTQDSMIEVGRARDSVERLRQLRVPLTYRDTRWGMKFPRKVSPTSRRGLRRKFYEDSRRGSEGASLKTADVGTHRFPRARTREVSTQRGWRGWPSRQRPIGCGRKACSLGPNLHRRG